jgi:DnaJ-class molecular chaperone
VNKNYYEVLGVSPDISLEELKKTYHKLVQKCHPDKLVNKPEVERKAAEEKFKEISVAYKEILEERKSKLAVVVKADEDAKENKTAGNTGSSEKLNKKKEEQEKKLDFIEEELKRTNEILENSKLFTVISEEILYQVI